MKRWSPVWKCIWRRIVGFILYPKMPRMLGWLFISKGVAWEKIQELKSHLLGITYIVIRNTSLSILLVFKPADILPSSPWQRSSLRLETC
ncbi:hypothetical protein TWF679_003656 [Orbilia oligospora]|uniref:Uncharacterized protein n=1 Tax=Orbilia oligospora TaxID=2813651 RepID=A0A8H8VEV1_ORBOL|nr:hypothetical protein TWF679_003656 [Orbilia oligospora]